MTDLKELTAFIPAAGYGTRMGERGIKNQKCMLPIFDEHKPIMFYIIDNLKSLGVTNFVIAVNHHKEEIKSFFKDGSSMGINIKYIEGIFNSTYDTLMKCISFLPNVFIYSHGDMVFNAEVYTSLLKQYNANNLSTIALIPNNKLPLTHPQLEIESGFVKNIYFKGAIGQYPYMYLGGAIYNKIDFLKHFDNDLSGMVEKVITQKLNHDEKVNAIIYKGEWRHLMNEEDYIKVANEKNWLKKEV